MDDNEGNVNRGLCLENDVTEKHPVNDNKPFGISYDAIHENGVVHPMTRTKYRITGRLCLAVFSAVMGSLAFGYNTGVINAPEEDIKNFMNATNVDRTDEAMPESTTKSLFSLIVAIFAVGGVIGGLTAGWWADYFGRKNGMFINNAIGIVAGTFMFFGRAAGSYEMVIIGRLLIGISCGLFTGLTPMYLAEIASADIRGALGTLHQFGVVTGLLASQVLGFPEIFGNADYWNLLLGLAVAPCIIQLLSMPFCPESPRYLLLKKDMEGKSRKALQMLRGTPDVDYEIEEIKSEDQSSSSEESIGIIALLKSSTLRRPLVISIMMHLSQQFSGINAIFYYSFNLFKNAGLEKTTAAHATSGVGGTMTLMTLITIPLMDRVGRRTLHLIGLGGMCVFSIFITLSLTLSYLADWLKIVTIVVSLCFVAFFALGPGSIPWLIVSELFPQGPRPAAMSVSVLINWIANFVVGYTFPYMQSGLDDYSFLPFAVLLGLFWLFTLVFVPETKNKTIEQISQLLAKQSNKKLQVYQQNTDNV